VDAKEYEYKGGDIKFNNVSFKHPAELNNKGTEQANEYLFQNLNFTLKEGTTNAIVGPSGFGKTTMLYLMVRH
jgi:ABC-type multidrug transport system fused ATPase/permease subunit